MKKIYNSLVLLVCLLVLNTNSLNAQLQDGSIAPDFTVTDINGVEHNLYDILNEGKTVILDVFATWCGPCWTYHQGHTLENVFNEFGPDGTDELFVMAVEADGSTDESCLYGPGSCNANSIGNWTTGISYPIVDNAEVGDLYNISFFPTIYIIYPNRIVNQLGQQSFSTIEEVKDDFEKAVTGLAPRVIKYNGFQGSLCQALWPVAPGYLVSNLGDETIESCDLIVRNNDEIIYEKAWTGNAVTYGVIEEIKTPTQIVTDNVILTLSIENINGDPDKSFTFTTGVSTSTDNRVNIYVETDEYSVEDKNRYEILNAANEVVVEGLLNENSTSIERTHILDSKECYTIQLLDDNNDGIRGAIEITDGNGAFIYSNVQNFGSAVARSFNVSSLLSGNDDVLTDVTLNLSPNPAEDELFVSISTGLSEDFNLTIMNGFGQIVTEQILVAKESNQKQINVDISDLPSGIHYLNIQNERGIVTKKFMIR